MTSDRELKLLEWGLAACMAVGVLQCALGYGWFASVGPCLGPCLYVFLKRSGAMKR